VTTQWSSKRGDTPEADLDLLIGDLCTSWGFCNQPSAADLLGAGGAVEADAFAAAVLRAEGMDPELETSWRRRIRRAFADRYGRSQISERSYEAG
jgi:hypothetical protein